MLPVGPTWIYSRRSDVTQAWMTGTLKLLHTSGGGRIFTRSGMDDDGFGYLYADVYADNPYAFSRVLDELTRASLAFSASTGPLAEKGHQPE